MQYFRDLNHQYLCVSLKRKKNKTDNNETKNNSGRNKDLIQKTPSWPGSAPSTLVSLTYAIIAITLATKESAVSVWVIGRWKMGGSVFNLSVNAQASEVCC